MSDLGMRDRLAAAIRSAQVRDAPVALTGPAVESIVDSILNQCQGLVVLGGKIRQIEIADRFGPESWEITTDRLPGDLEIWNDPELRHADD